MSQKGSFPLKKVTAQNTIKLSRLAGSSSNRQASEVQEPRAHLAKRLFGISHSLGYSYICHAIAFSVRILFSVFVLARFYF